MEILILGGTGAMGIPLVNILAEKKENRVYVTSRQNRSNRDNVTYIQGNARDLEFLHSVLKTEYDAIIDFMTYRTAEFRERVDVLLSHTRQYFFFSSARCYANAIGERITEDSSRLVDVCEDSEYLLTDEYALSKGREEDILNQCGSKNWTIIRPYITYNSQRIQLGVYEKENWLKRALEGRTILLPKTIAEKKTSLTYGPDVATIVAKLVGNEKALGEIFQIVTQESHTWGEILDFYCRVFEEKTGKRLKTMMPEDTRGLENVWGKWQICYDRLFDREFSNHKVLSVIGEYHFIPTFEGLEMCISNFLQNPEWLRFNAKYEAWCDRETGEYTHWRQIPGWKNKWNYSKFRIRG